MNDFLKPERLGPWRITATLGRGATAVVYRAEHCRTGTAAAIKVLVALGLQEGRLERFQREARLAARLTHPHLVRIYDAGRDGIYHYIVYEFVRGQSLGRIITTRGPLPEAAVLTVGRHMAAALGAIFQERLVHRDIKPDNILIDRQGRAKLADLGLGKDLAGPSMTATDQVMGTPHYIAPEQAQSSKNVDHRCDQYALGATLYHALAGRELFQGDSAFQILHRHVTEPIQPLRTLRPDLPEELCGVIERLLAKSPFERYATPFELQEQLERLQEKIGDFSLHTLLDPEPEATAVLPQPRGRPALRAQPPKEREDSAPEDKEGLAAPAPPAEAAPRSPGAGSLRVFALTAAAALCLVVAWVTLHRGRKGVGPAPSSNPHGTTAQRTGTLVVRSSAGKDPTTGLPEVLVNQKDGTELMLVPEGTFAMGHGEAASLWGPPHAVKVSHFYLARTEVTNVQYLRFFRETSSAERPSTWSEHDPPFSPEFGAHPVCGISWRAAAAYAAWAGLRLPAEEEWERAARGDDGRLFPYSASYQAGRAQDPGAFGFRGGGAEGLVAWRLRLREEKGKRFFTQGLGTAPVGSFRRGAGPYGHLNLTANVAEWTASLFRPYPGNRSPPLIMPPQESAARVHVIRGNSWCYACPTAPASVVRSWIEPAAQRRFDVGFRLAASVPKWAKPVPGAPPE